jgi:hypothetical protein
VIDAGVVLREERPGARMHAAALGLGLAVADGWRLRWPRTLFVASGVPVPWDLLEAGFALLERWDVAVPFTVDHVLAESLGTERERRATAAALFDLRIPVYSPKLLLVRESEAGTAFLATWWAECCSSGAGADERLAFLRAAAAVKPLMYVLPRAWFWPAAERAAADAVAGAVPAMAGCR